MAVDENKFLKLSAKVRCAGRARRSRRAAAAEVRRLVDKPPYQKHSNFVGHRAGVLQATQGCDVKGGVPNGEDVAEMRADFVYHTAIQPSSLSSVSNSSCVISSPCSISASAVRMSLMSSDISDISRMSVPDLSLKDACIVQNSVCRVKVA